MRGADYVPKKKAKKLKKAAKVEKALGWGGFDDQAKATQARPCTRQPLPPAPRGLHGLWRQWSARRPERAPLSLSNYCWAYATSHHHLPCIRVCEGWGGGLDAREVALSTSSASWSSRATTDTGAFLTEVHVLSLNVCTNNLEPGAWLLRGCAAACHL
jgi:hypothetical protein